MTRTYTPTRLYLDDDIGFEHHGAAVLLLVRNGQAKTWKSLVKAFPWDDDPREFHSGHLGLKSTIEGLVDAGLLISKKSYLGPYALTEQAHEVIEAMTLSLTQAANLHRHHGMAVLPFFGKSTYLKKAPHVFVIMPFADDLQPVYDGPVKQACRSLRFSVERADDIFSASAVMQDLWNLLVNSGAIVADCTGRNPNVFYELGIAHTLGKPVILISQRKEDIPFDIHYIRYIIYKPTNKGFEDLRRKLRKTLKATAVLTA